MHFWLAISHWKLQILKTWQVWKNPLIKVAGNGNFPSEENNYKSRGVFWLWRILLYWYLYPRWFHWECITSPCLLKLLMNSLAVAVLAAKVFFFFMRKYIGELLLNTLTWYLQMKLRYLFIVLEKCRNPSGYKNQMKHHHHHHHQ